LLTAMNHLIIRWFEGYPLIDQFPFNKWYEKHLHRPDQIQEDIANLRAEIHRLDKEALKSPIRARPPLRRQQMALQAEIQSLAGEQFFLYPASKWRILPTRLGNIIAAAEDYPEQLFGMDTVLLWPYLVPTLAESGYSKFIEREKAIFDLLLNSTVLIGLLGLEIGFLEAVLALAGWIWRLPLELLLFGGAVVVLYYLTSHGATGWAGTIRAAFVLYRHKLREALGLANPSSYKQERDLWILASEFYRNPADAAKIGLDPSLFNYEEIGKVDSES
jgi:hypothetical protein